MQRLELGQLGRCKKRFDLRIGTFKQRGHLIMLLHFGEARIPGDCFHLGILGDEDRADLPLLGSIQT